MTLDELYNKEAVRNQYKNLFNYSIDLIYVHDLKGQFLDANDETLKVFNRKREEIRDISFKDLIDKEQLLKAINVIREIKVNGKQLTYSEYKLKIKDDKFIYVETYGIPLKKKGRIYAILGIARDITERKKAELTLKEAEEKLTKLNRELEQKVIERTKELKEAEEKYRLILENANDLITIINQNFEHEYINEQAYFNLLGYTKEDIIGKTLLEPLHPDDIKVGLKILREGFKKGEGRGEMRIRQKTVNICG